ncbi:hypothetical protein COCON_G00212190, partial [Conger conger]
MDHREQAPTPLHIIAQSGGTAVVPQLHGCHAEGNITVIVNSLLDGKVRKGLFYCLY